MPDLLDTNVISELRKPRPEPRLIAYMLDGNHQGRFISSVSIAEINFGIHQMQDTSRREEIERWLADEVRSLFAGRILGVNEALLLRWLILLEHGRKSGRTYSQPDLLIAATAVEYGLALVTRNVRDFVGIPGLQLLNPWELS